MSPYLPFSCHPKALIQPLNEAQVEALKRAFTKVAGVDGEIDSEELRDILNVAFTRGLVI
ncbi:hypothetical protein X801_10502 [Opisthorchis viverrini]|uniref:EF-hand domain-containing protein n=1 Tax=Opisthorchis viverrini TaxID=6198 RepID=A0A1S8WH06_OPIVI|nr:hypothetical protein X801_10502 [Opisthorchis viverrini]